MSAISGFDKICFLGRFLQENPPAQKRELSTQELGELLVTSFVPWAASPAFVEKMKASIIEDAGEEGERAWQRHLEDDRNAILSSRGETD